MFVEIRFFLSHFNNFFEILQMILKHKSLSIFANKFLWHDIYGCANVCAPLKSAWIKDRGSLISLIIRICFVVI